MAGASEARGCDGLYGGLGPTEDLINGLLECFDTSDSDGHNVE